MKVYLGVDYGGQRVGLHGAAAEDEQRHAREDESDHGAKSNKIRDGRGRLRRLLPTAG